MDPDAPPYILQEGTEYVIGVVNPATGQMLKLTMGRQTDPSGNYGFTILDRQDQGKLDTANPGHKDLERLPFQDGHQEIWGVNTQTGAFEKVPTARGS